MERRASIDTACGSIFKTVDKTSPGAYSIKQVDNQMSVQTVDIILQCSITSMVQAYGTGFLVLVISVTFVISCVRRCPITTRPLLLWRWCY